MRTLVLVLIIVAVGTLAGVGLLGMLKFAIEEFWETEGGGR